MNVQPLHLDAEFSRNGLIGRQIFNSIFTLGHVTGIPVQDATLGTNQAVLVASDQIDIADTLRVETRALD
ncbi:MaoC/PaaZ C-terminal domain-containing protein [Arthrobacter sp. StoSoilB20]|uniref:MaoC/PaaZ C-terminal domain-containing protein n=1 Tax=Arthrobacter sp. StoSoilB20 TaxID=2830995 RepID=UPI001E6AB491|nr:MaoC/PaaZ C-terminal domain-containing protein [Arthrobacter sp. StoSoilB20]BCW58570.1 hypothetical protein StoSoilB20_19170 [Arthrobacter sp. StoSoilB20]